MAQKYRYAGFKIATNVVHKGNNVLFALLTITAFKSRLIPAALYKPVSTAKLNKLPEVTIAL